jgi:hypothetical protein
VELLGRKLGLSPALFDIYQVCVWRRLMSFSPIVNGVKVSTIMLNVEIRPRLLCRDVGFPIIGNEGNIGITHDYLSEHIKAVI